MYKNIIAAAALAVLGGVGTASAATLTFDSTLTGFTISGGRVVSGNCESGKCYGLNKNETGVLTYSGGPFTLDGFWFTDLGAKTKLTVTSSAGVTKTYGPPEYDHNTGYTISGLGSTFADVTWIKFTANLGNVRLDNIMLTTPPAPVPLPAAGLLLLGGVGSLAALRRRRA